jgi:hypothetical protein
VWRANRLYGAAVLCRSTFILRTQRSRPDVEKVEYVEYDGPVCYQTVARKQYCAKNNMTWSEVLGAKTKNGLHPFLKLKKVKKKALLLANPSLRPRECYRQLMNEYQDKDQEDLF